MMWVTAGEAQASGCEKHRKESQTAQQAEESKGPHAHAPELTAVLLVAAVRTVLKAVAAEAADDAVDAAGTREEGRATFRLCFGCRRKRHTEGCVRRWSSLATASLSHSP